MKKAIKFMLGLIAMLSVCAGLTACSEEVAPPQPPVREGEVDVVMTTSLPQAIQSYAVNSSEGGLINLEDKGYQVRYIMEIYPKGSDSRIDRQIQCVPLKSTGDDYRQASFKSKLLPAEYDFVFWADIVREVSTLLDLNSTDIELPIYSNAYFYSNKTAPRDISEELYRPIGVNSVVEGDLKTICANNKKDISEARRESEFYDAFSCIKSLDIRSELPSEPIILKRPFAKLRLVTTDADMKGASIDWTNTEVKISGDNTLPYEYNARSGQFKNVSDAYGYWTSFIRCGEYTDDISSVKEKTLGVFYLPIPTEAQNFEFTIKVNDKDATLPLLTKVLKVDMVPLVGNKLTTIKGNLLSQEANVSITIDDEFDQPGYLVPNEVATVEGFNSALSGDSEIVTFTGNVSKASPFELDFDNIAGTMTTYSEDGEVSYLYGEGNNAELTLKFASVEEGAVLTFKGQHTPSVLRIVTDTKCSLLIDMTKSKIHYDGKNYKYIVTNAGCKSYQNGAEYDALFLVKGAGGFYSSNDESHNYKNINADFTLPQNLNCLYTEDHSAGTCAFLDTVKSWLTTNNKTKVWDFVADSNN